MDFLLGKEMRLAVKYTSVISFQLAIINKISNCDPFFDLPHFSTQNHTKICMQLSQIDFILYQETRLAVNYASVVSFRLAGKYPSVVRLSAHAITTQLRILNSRQALGIAASMKLIIRNPIRFMSRSAFRALSPDSSLNDSVMLLCE